ncbi:MAG: trypsin-like serine protease [Planctomycetota bacterium]
MTCLTWFALVLSVTAAQQPIEPEIEEQAQQVRELWVRASERRAELWNNLRPGFRDRQKELPPELSSEEVRFLLELGPDLAPLIVGGVPTGQSHPETVALLNNDGEVCCSGVFISPRVVLTARHCLNQCAPVFVSNAQVASREGAVRVVKHRSHPKYDGRKHDLMLLLVEKPLAGVTPASLRFAGNERLPGPLRVIGYGLSEDGGSDQGIKQAVEARLTSAPCRSREDLRRGCFRSIEMIAMEVGKDSCQYDSGGPAFVAVEPGGWGLVGLVRAGFDGGRCGDGGIYLRLAPKVHMDFIVETLELWGESATNQDPTSSIRF